jgi:uncharacterized protein (TIGR02413 family)
MVFNIFFLTITITKRRFSKADLERAYKAQHNEQLVEKNKHRSLTIQQFL